MAASIVLSAAVRKAIVDHARREQPRECCGLLLGAGRSVQYAAPMRNMAGSTTRYRIGDAAHIDLRRVIRPLQPQLEIVGVYHSHPAGEARPSSIDLKEAMYPQWVYLIVGLARGRAVLRAFRIRGGKASPVAIR